MLRFGLLVLVGCVWVCGCSPASDDPRLQSNATLREACGGGSSTDAELDSEIIEPLLWSIEAARQDGISQEDLVDSTNAECSAAAATTYPDDPEPHAIKCSVCVGAVIDQIYGE